MFCFIIIHLCRFMLLLVSEHSSMIWFYHTFMLFRFLIIICSPKASLNSIVKYNLFLVTLKVYGFAFNSFISFTVYSFHCILSNLNLTVSYALVLRNTHVSILINLLHLPSVYFTGFNPFFICPLHRDSPLFDISTLWFCNT